MDRIHPFRWPTAAVAVVAAALAGSLVGGPADAAAPTSSVPRTEPTRHALRTLDAAEARALLDLYAVEAALGRARARAAATARRAAAARERVAAERRTLTSVRASRAAARAQLEDRLRFLYRSGHVDTVAVLLTAGSLDDALGRLDALRRLTRGDTRLVATMETAERHVRTTLEGLATAEARLAAAARDADREARALVGAVAERRRVVTDLARRRRLTAARLQALEAAAREADRRAAEVARRVTADAASDPPEHESGEGDSAPDAAAGEPQAPEAEPDAPAAATGGTLQVVATAYTLRGATATGVPTQRGVCAVDPTVIPLGTRFEVPGYGGCVAADTGGAVLGAHVDVWVATAAEAATWGRRTVTITLG